MNSIVLTLTLYAVGPSGAPVVATLGHFEAAAECVAASLPARRAARRAGLQRVRTLCIQTVVPVPDTIPGPQGPPGPRGRDGRDCGSPYHGSAVARVLRIPMPDEGPVMGSTAAPGIRQ